MKNIINRKLYVFVIISLFVITGVNKQAKAAECIANAATLKSAIAYFESKCKVNYNTGQGHSCQKKSNGGYRCRTGASATPTPPSDPGDGGGYQPPSGRCSVKWSPASSKLASSSWGSGSAYTGGKSRVSYNASTNSVAIMQSKTPKQLSEHRPSTPWVKGNTARMTVDLFIPSNYKPNKDNRFAIGMRGGQNVNQKFISGGGQNAGKQQDGWSVRINYNDKLYPMIYSYHLNRNGNGNFGTVKTISKAVPKGQWVTMVLDVTLNTVGKSNGFAKLTMHNSNGGVIASGTFSNLMFRKNASWDKFGIILTDKNEKGAATPASILHRNYKLVVGDGGNCN